MFDQFENMEKINLLEGEDDLGSDSCPCSCHPGPGNLLKFIYSEKVTKFCEISTVCLTNVVTVKSTREVSQNFAAFSEYINFKGYCQLVEFGSNCGTAK